MGISDIRGKSAEELQSLLTDLKKEQFNLRFQKVTGELENTARIKQVRKDIARVVTLLNQNKKKAA